MWSLRFSSSLWVSPVLYEKAPSDPSAYLANISALPPFPSPLQTLLPPGCSSNLYVNEREKGVDGKSSIFSLAYLVWLFYLVSLMLVVSCLWPGKCKGTAINFHLRCWQPAQGHLPPDGLGWWPGTDLSDSGKICLQWEQDKGWDCCSGRFSWLPCAAPAQVLRSAQVCWA